MSQQEKLSLSKHDLAVLKSLTPGSVVDLQIDTPTAPQRLKTFYIGMDIMQGFIFQVPNTHKWANIRDRLVAGNGVVVRFVIEGELGQVIAFKVDILKCYSKPLSMLVTAFPTKIQTMGLRAEKRSQPGIPVNLFLDKKEDGEAVKALIVDVSKQGCKLAVQISPEHEKLPVNKNITLGCKLDGESIRIESTVKNVLEEKGYCYYGVHFTGKQSGVDTLLERHIISV